MARIDLATITGYESMTPEQKVAALEGFEFDTSELEALRGKTKEQKALIDKYTGEIGALKKKQNEGLSEAERKAQEQEQRLAELQEQYDKLYISSKVAEYKARYLALGYEESLAADTAAALAGGDMEKVFANGEKYKAELEKKQRSDAAKNTPKPDGKGSANISTREDILKIKDPVERRQAISEHLDLFE